jgi:N-methylhydantoinase A
MQEHLTTMAHDLREAGLGGELLVAVSVGGVMHVDDVIERPIYLVRSGPSLAPVAGRAYASEEGFAEGSVIVCDTGGTSFDVSLVRGSDLVATREAWLGPRFTGHLTGLSAVDVRSIGAGGGSIAWVDDGGLLRVGPQSAGSNPGPAAYRLGGREPTVTDAAAVLGYLDPDFFLGGRIVLDVDAARAAIEPVAAALGIGSDRCASAILAVANEQMIAAIKEITVNEGIDPRDSLIVAGGGAGGLNVVPIAAGLGCRRVLVPRTAGALSSCGAQFSDVVAEFTVTEFTTSGAFDVDAVNAALARVDAEIEAFGRGLRARGLTDQSTSYVVEARYPYQVWDLPVPVVAGRFEGGADVAALAEAFHATHERVFAVREPEQYVEFVNWRGRLTVALDHPPSTPAGWAVDGHDASPVFRRAYFDGVGFQEATVHRGASLAPGSRVPGPAVIEEVTTTLVVYPGAEALVTPAGHYLLEIGGAVPA